MPLKFKAKAITSILVLCILSSQAEAKKCDPTDNDIEAANMAVSKINARISTMELNLIQTLKLHAGQLSAYITQQTTSIGRMFDAQNQANAQIERESNKIKATRDFLPSKTACEAVSGIRGLEGGLEQAELIAKTKTLQQVSRLTNTQGSPSQKGQIQDTAQRWERRVSTWCSPEKQVDGKDLCSAPAEQHNNDINPHVLLGKDTLSEDIDRLAAQDFITNLVIPFAPDPISLLSVESDEDRKRHLERISTQTRLSLAASVLDQAYAERTPTVDLGNWARALLPEKQDIPETISVRELNKILVKERFENPNYHISLQSMEPENVRREMASQQALMLSLLSRMNDRNEQIAILQATLVSMAAENKLASQTNYPGTAEAAGTTNPVTSEAE